MNSKNVTENSISNQIDPMRVYRVIVAARNNVKEARNGSSVEMRGKKYKPFHFFSIIKHAFIPSFLFFFYSQKSS